MGWLVLLVLVVAVVLVVRSRSSSGNRPPERCVDAVAPEPRVPPLAKGAVPPPEPNRRLMVRREDYVPKEEEARYLTRDERNLPVLRLVDAGDRLAIWSPVDGGALINPKGPGLRQLGLCSSYARGSNYYPSAYRAADLRKGQWVDLLREPDNPHDKNAVAMCAPGTRVPFAHVQRGRVPAVARRMDAGD